MTGIAPFITKLIDSQSDDETTGRIIDCLGHSKLTVFLEGIGTTSSGVLTIEQACWDKDEEPAYGGTWSSITTMNASDVTGGAQKAYNLTVAAYAFVRVRISTAIGGGGTVSVYLVGQE